MGHCAVAVDIGGTKTTAALVEVGADETGAERARVLASATAPTPAQEGAQAQKKPTAAGDELAAAGGSRR